MDDLFGIWVKRRRKALDLTQQQLAQRVGCSLATIVKIESDERRPSRQIAALLAEYLEIPMEQRDLFLKVARQAKGSDALQRLASLPDVRSIPFQPFGQPSLPIPPTPLVGREHEVQAILLRLQDPVCRLLTLTGPGGVGKTRLSLAVAHQALETFGTGAYFVPLVGTSAAEFIVPAVADALGFVFSGATELKGQLFNYLKDKQALLILDNLEHLLNGIELLDELLERAPQVKILATSREQLNLRAEWVFEVQGLPVPARLELSDLKTNGAAALFLQRAQQTQVNFTPRAVDLPPITRICQLVEGLPLGLELAASWVRVMSLEEIANEIERGLDFLSTTLRDSPQRHRSMRAVFDYSWNLLSGEERRALRRLSVFRGGFTREAAEKVVGAPLPLLSALVDKSLVRRNPSGRYDLHELLRQYAAAQLESEVEETQEVYGRHAEFYISLLEANKSVLQSHRQRQALNVLFPETDNLRAAWNEAVANRRLGLIRAGVWSLWYMYELRPYFQEGEALLKRAIDMLRSWLAELEPSLEEGNEIAGVLGTVLAYDAFFCFRLGRNIESQRLFEESLALLRHGSETTSLAFALGHYGILQSLKGAYEAAVLNTREAIQLSRTLEDHWQVALYSTFLGMELDDQGSYSEAYAVFSEALQTCRSLGDPRLISLAAGYLGQTAHTLGRFTEVPDLLREGLQAAAETNDRFAIALAGVRMALAAQTRGNGSEARRHLQESIQHFREAGDTWFLSHALNLEGKIALASGELKQAQESFRESGKVALSAQAFPMLLDALTGLAMVDAQQDQQQRALVSVMHILENPSSTQDTKNRSEKLWADLSTQLSREQVEWARAQVQNTSFDALVQERLLS